MADDQKTDTKETPARWTGKWFLMVLNAALLGQIKIPGILGLAFAVFWGVPTWKSKFEFWAEVARSSDGWGKPFADVLLWPYFSPVLGLVSFIYLVIVSGNSGSAPRRSTVLAAFAWVFAGAVFLTITAGVGFGALEFYIRTEIEKGKAGIPRDSSPANSIALGVDRPLYTNAARGLTENQRRLLIQQSDRLKQISHIQITYLATDMEAFNYAQNFRAAFQRAAVQANGPSEQPLADANDSGVMIEVRNSSVPSQAALTLQQVLATLDIQAKFVELPSQYGDLPSTILLFIGPRPIQQ